MGKRDVRAAFRLTVFTRDLHTCQVCGKRWTAADAAPDLGRINAHHIVDRHEFTNGGYVQENGITVCDGVDSCHMKCERFHITGGKAWVPGLHPDELYAKIGSSLDLAIEADERNG